MDEEELRDIDPENDDADETADEDIDNDDGGNKDPFDEIDDLEEMRAKAKEERAKRQRFSKKDKIIVKPEPKKDDSRFVTKDDFYKGNEKKAYRELTTVDKNDDEETIEFKKELKANWKDAMRFYRNVSGKETVEDIVDDVTDAYYSWKRRNPSEEENEENQEKKKVISVLSKKTGKGGSSPSDTPNPKKSVLRRKASKGTDQMMNWYPSEDD